MRTLIILSKFEPHPRQCGLRFLATPAQYPQKLLDAAHLMSPTMHSHLQPFPRLEWRGRLLVDRALLTVRPSLKIPCDPAEIPSGLVLRQRPARGQHLRHNIVLQGFDTGPSRQRRRPWARLWLRALLPYLLKSRGTGAFRSDMPSGARRLLQAWWQGLPLPAVIRGWRLAL